MRPMWAELVHLEEGLHPRDSDLHPKDSGLHPRDGGTHSQPQPPVTLLGLEYQLQVGQRSYCACVQPASANTRTLAQSGAVGRTVLS